MISNRVNLTLLIKVADFLVINVIKEMPLVDMCSGALAAASALLVSTAILPFLSKRRFLYTLTSFSAACAVAYLGILLCQRTFQWVCPEPVYLGVAPLSLGGDSLTGVFCILLGGLYAFSSLFSHGYLTHLEGTLSCKLYWPALSFFVLGMLGVILAQNSPTFLVAFELMSISSACLVGFDFTKGKVMRPLIIYVGATRIASAFIAGGFLCFYLISHSFDLLNLPVDSPAYALGLILVTLGLLVKAGCWPFHLWLPYAHPQAPSPMSALMSAVMVKVALYAIFRLALMSHSGSFVLGCLLMSLGLISAFWGALLSFVQSDLKKLLAYSTVENVGLILVCLGVFHLARCLSFPNIAGLALLAGIVHCFSHGLFKTLLFLGSGAVDSVCHTRELDKLGGLARKMPRTALAFLGGVASSAALPPFFGFFSKWLIYQCLFQAALVTVHSCKIFSVACLGSIVILSLVGGLALAASVKAYAVPFLGRCRTSASEHAHEVSFLMRSVEFVLLCLCLAGGLFSTQIMLLVASLFPGEIFVAALPAPLGLLPLFSFLTIMALGLSCLDHPRKFRRYKAWECGYGELSTRMQITAATFSQSVTTIFAPVIKYTHELEIEGKDRRHFPERLRLNTHFESLLEARVYRPIVATLEMASRLIQALQAGSVHRYLLYSLVCLLLLLFIERLL
jgi:formate hydrogenlyase subunit 3/multisubunit Na+/H+ antiporter MnhD subunit